MCRSKLESHHCRGCHLSGICRTTYHQACWWCVGYKHRWGIISRLPNSESWDDKTDLKNLVHVWLIWCGICYACRRKDNTLYLADTWMWNSSTLGRFRYQQHCILDVGSDSRLNGANRYQYPPYLPPPPASAKTAPHQSPVDGRSTENIVVITIHSAWNRGRIPNMVES